MANVDGLVGYDSSFNISMFKQPPDCQKVRLDGKVDKGEEGGERRKCVLGIFG